MGMHGLAKALQSDPSWVLGLIGLTIVASAVQLYPVAKGIIVFLRTVFASGLRKAIVREFRPAVKRARTSVKYPELYAAAHVIYLQKMFINFAFCVIFMLFGIAGFNDGEGLFASSETRLLLARVSWLGGGIFMILFFLQVARLRLFKFVIDARADKLKSRIRRKDQNR
jgi:hypothetical protein